jgi:murein DD-endopeptidase MepM/ murein hydrolase activator NlpD
VIAVADATVVTVVNDLAEALPHVVLKGLPVADLGGNRVVLKIRDGVYAFYAHLKTGSVSVKPGDTVRRGQVIANAGNSGNTTESHLHFHLMDGVAPLTATNLPWEIDAFRYLGQVNTETVDASGAGDRTKELPLINSAETFPTP